MLIILVMGDLPEKKMIRFDTVSNSIRFNFVQPISSHFQHGSVDCTIVNSGPSVCQSGQSTNFLPVICNNLECGNGER